MAPNNSKMTFQKFKDSRVQRNSHEINRNRNRKDFNYSKELAKTIKRRALTFANKAATGRGIKRKLDYNLSNQWAAKQQLPKPKIYHKHKLSKVNETIGEGELISSDEDDDSVTIVEDGEDRKPTSSGYLIDKTADYHAAWTVNNSCIVIDDEDDDDGVEENDISVVEESPQKEKILTSPNDSVIFVAEQRNGVDFIPLPAADVEEPSPKRRRRCKESKETTSGEPTPKRNGPMNASLFTVSEHKKLTDYNTNTYNPGTKIAPAGQPNKRPIIIDGSNVAFSHGCSNVFSTEGIKHCVDYFLKMGHDVKVVVPLFRRNAHKSSNPALLDQLHKENRIVFTPCKNLPNQQSISYDDRFILQLAYERNAAVVSNDNYRDLIHENPAFKKIIENRVIGYSWCDDIFLLPKDPYGRFGPPLSEILRC